MKGETSMANANAGKRWSKADILTLKHLVKGNTPTRLIGIKLERTPDAIASKAHKIGISLKPTNQEPYNRLRK